LVTSAPAIIPQFALAPAWRAGQSRHGRIAGKLSRLLARNIITKPLRMSNSRPLVTFTFDDAPASACETGALLVEKYQARATYYISGGGCGVMSPGGRLAGAAQVKSLSAKGHEIGCHTYSHACVAGVSHDALIAELERNRSFLHGLDADISLRNFAYPYGDLSFAAKHRLERRFDSCRSLLPGVNVEIADLGALKSCELQNASIDREGVRKIVAETVHRSGWLIFVSHDVENEPSRFGISPELLEFALETACAGCRIVTIGEALRILRSSDGSRKHAASSYAQIAG
jgi:peptidoglycan/xylan/chitin deacetylase (PgdA/CDA1 family)